jgi:cytochrome c peroxidase
MHDGGLTTLAEVVAFYDRGGTPNPWLSSDVRPLGLTAQERSDVVEFMRALTREVAADVSRPPMLPR